MDSALKVLSTASAEWMGLYRGLITSQIVQRLGKVEKVVGSKVQVYIKSVQAVNLIVNKWPGKGRASKAQSLRHFRGSLDASIKLAPSLNNWLNDAAASV